MRALRPRRSASHGDWHTAMQHYGEALQRNRCNGAFWHFRGLAATQLDQPQQAVRRMMTYTACSTMATGSPR